MSDHSSAAPLKQQPAKNQAKDTAQPLTGQLQIQHLYVKEQSAKVHNAPAIFKQEAKPESSLELNVQNRLVAEHQFEVVLSLHLTLKLEQQTALVVEVEQAGIFFLKDFSSVEQAFILGAYCPGVLYPYGRKIVSDLMLAAGFAPITAPPINFEQMYHERQQQQQAGKDTKQSPNQADLITRQ